MAMTTMLMGNGFFEQHPAAARVRVACRRFLRSRGHEADCGLTKRDYRELRRQARSAGIDDAYIQAVLNNWKE